MEVNPPPGERVQPAGVGFALAAYTVWGLAPLYWHWVAYVSPTEVLAHRVAWTLLLLVVLTLVSGRWGALRHLPRRSFGALFVSGLLIGTNWWVFVYSVQHSRMLEASLGYYINPLLSVFLGLAFLGERLRPLQWLAVLLAALGVANEVRALGTLPWISLVLAVSFALYGFVRKRVLVDPLIGLGVETGLMLPLALGYLVLLGAAGQGVVGGGSLWNWLQLALAGVITAFPLLCFAAAAGRMPLSILGLFQYLAPTLTMVLAVQLYGERFRPDQWLTFGAIWLGLLLLSAESLLRRPGRFRR